jgi:PAS domain S-box-containing protein
MSLANIVSYNAKEWHIYPASFVKDDMSRFGDDLDTKATSFFGDKIETFSVMSFTTLLLLFFILFTKNEYRFRKNRYLLLIFLPWLYFTLMILWSLLINADIIGFIPVSWGYAPILHVWEYIIMIWLVLSYLSIFGMSYYSYKRAVQIKEKNKIKAITWAFGVSLILGVTLQLAPYIFPRMPFLLVSTLVSIIPLVLIGYVIARYELRLVSPSIVADRILDTMADYLIVLNTENEISFASSSFLKVSCLKDTDIRNRNVKDVLKMDLSFEDLMKDVERSVVVDRQAEVIFNEKKIPVLINAAVIKDNSARVIGYMFIMKDMTQIKTLINDLHETNDQLVKSNEKLHELDKLKDMFISISAHELKTPLTSIKGFTQLLQDEHVMNDETLRNHYLNLISKNSEALYNLVLDIVDSSRLSLGKLSVNLEQVSVGEVFSEIKDDMEMIIRKNPDVQPVFVMEDNLPDICVDRNRLMQVLRNIIINSTHFTQKGEISLRIYKTGEAVQFEIKDTGSGIPPEAQKNIFSRFYQVNSEMQKKVQGSGLGLSISKGLIDLMGGKIWFESEVGKGTTFYFTIPISKSSSKGDL